MLPIGLLVSHFDDIILQLMIAFNEFVVTWPDSTGYISFNLLSDISLMYYFILVLVFSDLCQHLVAHWLELIVH